MRDHGNITSYLHPVTSAVVLVILDNLPPAYGHLLTTSTSTAIILRPLDAPIEDVVVLVAFTNEKVTEELAQVRIIRFVVESERTSVVEEDTKFIGETAAKGIGGGGHP